MFASAAELQVTDAPSATRSLALAVAFIGFTFLGRPVLAETDAPGAAPGNTGLEEVVVTARRRSENIQSVPLSVTAISSLEMVESNMRTMQDFPLLTPGLQANVNSSAGTSVLFNIRGFTQSGQCFQCEAPVSTYVDGVYRQSTNDLQGALFDLDNAQVLKGPQGTLYGKNTTGGAVLIATRKPDLNEGFGGYATGGAGSPGPTHAAIRALPPARDRQPGAGRGAGAVCAHLLPGDADARLLPPVRHAVRRHLPGHGARDVGDGGAATAPRRQARRLLARRTRLWAHSFPLQL